MEQLELKLWKAICQIILMESDSHEGAERYRESHLISLFASSCGSLRALTGISPSRLGGEEERRVESIGQLLAYASLLP